MSGYPPSAYRVQDREKLLDIIHHFPLAWLMADSKPETTTSIPLMHARNNKLIGHLNAGNPWLRQVEQHTWALFRSNNSYISPSAHAHNLLPTWWFAEVRVRALVRTIEDPGNKLELLHQLTQYFENHYGYQGSLNPDDSRVEALLPHITGVELQIESMEGLFMQGLDKEKTVQKELQHQAKQNANQMWNSYLDNLQ